MEQQPTPEQIHQQRINAIVHNAAKMAHQINKAYCLALGDDSQQDWEQAPEWQRQSAVDGVAFCLENPDMTPADSHASWMAKKKEDGWVFGEVKDPEKKTHPCMVPFDQLPAEQKAKDFLFQAAVHNTFGMLGLVRKPDNVHPIGGADGQGQ